MALPLWANDAEARHPSLASSAKAGTGTMVKPWAAPLTTTSGTPRCKPTSDTTGAQGNQGATVKNHRSKGLRFRALGTMDRQLDQVDAI